ncbi:MAG: hypothetical protein BA863_01335 [Desulfovibrio sp. S3730MH75]|nr:MAG: hypothetical protein BA863_01335 [Desulfovibrio sp. S3730MH75]
MYEDLYIERKAPDACGAQVTSLYSPSDGSCAKGAAGRYAQNPAADKVQTKPDIGERDGKYEQEADHVANRIAAHLLAVPVRLFSSNSRFVSHRIFLILLIEFLVLH